MRFIPLLLLACVPIFANPPATAPTTRQAYAHYFADHDDDVAWENDRIAFRVFGPGSEKLGIETGSGVDVWCKATTAPIIDRWYAAGNYKEEHGEGLDFYGVSTSRGCGGLGIWDGKSLVCSKTFATQRILNAGPQRVQFEITYAPWIVGGRKVWETRRISMEVGANLYRVTSTIASDDSATPLNVGIGVARRSGEGGELTRDKRRAILSYWQPPDKDHGTIAVGLVVDPARFLEFQATAMDYLAIVKVTPGAAFSYYAGAAWSRRAEFTAPEAWLEYLRAFPARFDADK